MHFVVVVSKLCVEPSTKKFKWGSKNHKFGKAAVTGRASCKEYASTTCYEMFRGLDALKSVQNGKYFLVDT